MHLLGIVKSSPVLVSRLGIGGATACWVIEEFTAQMRAVSKIALHRRSNLATFLETNGIEVTSIFLSLFSYNLIWRSQLYTILIFLVFTRDTPRELARNLDVPWSFSLFLSPANVNLPSTLLEFREK